MNRILAILAALVFFWAGAARAEGPAADARIYLQTSRLAGFRYYEGRKLWSRIQVRDALTLAREMDNPYDANAIRVEWQGHKLGFVPRADNAALARFMDRGQPLAARVTALPKDRRHGRAIEFDIFLERQ